MAVFDELDWQRLDVTAIVTHGGLATIALDDYPRYADWLAEQGYVVERLDCSPGFGPTLEAFGRMQYWEEQFGYALTANSANLDAIRDGFEFDIDDGGGCVFELHRPDLLWLEHGAFLTGLLAIACEHTRLQLALGRRFFTSLIVPGESPLLGVAVDAIKVPWPQRWA